MEEALYLIPAHISIAWNEHQPISSLDGNCHFLNLLVYLTFKLLFNNANDKRFIVKSISYSKFKSTSLHFHPLKFSYFLLFYDRLMK